jgi:thiamine-monophosphate kinase|tara:strand:- start:16104 stop:16982 length:879 start_codon:yes stop_codon:yes gene_type:complete
LSSEFELIELFQHIGAEYYKENGVLIGPGDDCAIFDLSTPIITSVDSSVVDIHFPSNASPQDIGYRAVAVALSDIAAMGCRPIAFSLSVSSPVTDDVWYKKLAEGVEDIAKEFEISLIGGDLTKGPLNLNAIVYGTPYSGKILMRNTAQPGDYICISSPTGRARRGLNDWKNTNNNSEYLTDYLRPLAKIELGKTIVNFASACIDTSDGLLADLGKILKLSECGALIYLDDIPITTDIDDINSGDDYDLCFTVPKDKFDNNYFKIGEVTSDRQIKLISNKGYDINIKGYEHF